MLSRCRCVTCGKIQPKSAYTAQVRYVFSIAPMSPKQAIEERFSPHGRWRPPKGLGNNLTLPPAYFSFDGQTTSVQTRNAPDLLQNAVLHKTYSIYYDRAIFWIVPYDASKERVDDGEENTPSEDLPTENIRPGSMNTSGFQNQSAASSDVSDDESGESTSTKTTTPNVDWSILKFDHRDSDKLTYASRRQPHSRLCVRRRSQEWAQKILPDSCDAQPQNVTDNKNLGGLIGELPLLIGLMAFALPETNWEHLLCQAMGQRWSAPNAERSVGCKPYSSLLHATRVTLTDIDQGATNEAWSSAPMLCIHPRQMTWSSMNKANMALFCHKS